MRPLGRIVMNYNLLVYVLRRVTTTMTLCGTPDDQCGAGFPICCPQYVCRVSGHDEKLRCASRRKTPPPIEADDDYADAFYA